MSKTTIMLDVRADIQNGREPLGRILQAVGRLKDSEQLLLIAPFEPTPLYAVLGQRGFAHQSKPTAAGDWEVLFTRGQDGPAAPQAAAAPPQAAPGSPGRACGGPPVLEVDGRGLEPPQPLVKILEALTTLPAGAQLRARTNHRPVHLPAHLEERGFVGETTEEQDGSFVTLIRRR